MSFPLRSLTLRLTLISAIWVGGGLSLAGWLAFTVLTRQVEAAFDSRLAAQLDALVAALSVSADARPRVASRALSDPEFQRPLSGHYWQVTAGDGRMATSPSLWDARLPPPPASTGRQGQVQVYSAAGPRGEEMRVLARVVTPSEETRSSLNGTAPLLVQVASTTAEAQEGIAQTSRILLLVFTILGLGLVAGAVGQVLWALMPLRRVRRALAEVRDGSRETLQPLQAPLEVAPLVVEIDELVAQNRATIERARTHVGNLAHALKTPIAVLRVSLQQDEPDVEGALGEAAAMERLVDHHLARARVGALAGAAAVDTPALAVAEEIATAMARLPAAAHLELRAVGDSAATARVDRQDLAEMIGNLAENACKWARSRVSIAVSLSRNPAPDGEARPVVLIAVEDDGAGMGVEQREAAIGRGTKLDEAVQGSGLGLSIVADLSELVGGRLSLGVSALGGLAARLELPARARGARVP
ncbi:HAMP domain-containing histidine kinase [Roseococcus sp. SYP-B2431]|uniref:sensor histidine kinase n=1 Tax=Roseococcus sp. SYP-B2431 TaxID=2496640 RepID=UPI00103FEA3D|nr:sensor histidine kinase [Roseococcus sp. SYP-B2431]TCH96740.1 HAMP domain-containing histidine kinase [Roseococcus sp. SYP-B2431]